MTLLVNLFIRSVINLKGYHSDITHNIMTPHTTFGVVFVISSTMQPSKSLIEAETEAIPGSSTTIEVKFDSR